MKFTVKKKMTATWNHRTSRNFHCLRGTLSPGSLIINIYTVNIYNLTTACRSWKSFAASTRCESLLIADSTNDQFDFDSKFDTNRPKWPARGREKPELSPDISQREKLQKDRCRRQNSARAVLLRRSITHAKARTR